MSTRGLEFGLSVLAKDICISCSVFYFLQGLIEQHLLEGYSTYVRGGMKSYHTKSGQESQKVEEMKEEDPKLRHSVLIEHKAYYFMGLTLYL